VPPELGFFSITPTGGTLTNLPGVEWTRETGILWAEVERPPASGNYVWDVPYPGNSGTLDGTVMAAVNNGLNIVLVLKSGHPQGFVDDACYTAASENSSNDFNKQVSCPILPEFETAWRNWVRAIIRRYGKGKYSYGAMPGLTDSFTLALEIENEAADGNFWNPDVLSDGKLAAENYLRLLKQSYLAKQLEEWDGEIILSGLTLMERTARCANNPDLAGCDANYDTRNRVFTEEILRHPQYFDAIDIHFFNYYYFLPFDIPNAMAYLRQLMALNGYTKPIYALEFTSSIPIWLRNRGGANVYSPHFPYITEFGPLGYLDDQVAESLAPNSGPIELSFGGNYGAGESILEIQTAFPPDGRTIYAVRFRGVNDGLFDFFDWTEDYRQAGAPGPPTVWIRDIEMFSPNANYLSHGVSVLWGQAQNHTGDFAVGALAHPRSEEHDDVREARLDAVLYYYQNLDFLELPPEDPPYLGINADPKYREWFEKEDAEDYPKVVCTMLAEGITRFVHVGFHHYFPGYVWSNRWWKWHGVIRYTGGTQAVPVYVRTPMWWSHQQLMNAITGYSGVSEFALDPSVTCFQLNFANAESKYIFWSKPTGTTASSYDPADPTVVSTTIPVNIALAAGWNSATINEIVKALDGSNNPIYTTTTVSSAATTDAIDTPKIATRAS
jgi:hypothetical protein